jgi:hypothetical protein
MSLRPEGWSKSTFYIDSQDVSAYMRQAPIPKNEGLAFELPLAQAEVAYRWGVTDSVVGVTAVCYF